MKKLFLICLSFLFLITACTKYEIRNVIYPEVTIIGDKIGISYMLGPIKVNDTIKDASNQCVRYFIENKSNIKMDLYIEYKDIKNTNTRFKYYIKGILMAENIDVVSSDNLLKHRDEIDGFVLIKLNGTNYIHTNNNPQVNELKSEPIKEREADPKSETFKRM